MSSPPDLVVLSAGASTRMGSPKALLRVEGRTFLRRILATAEAAGLKRAWVVLAAPAEDSIRTAEPADSLPLRPGYLTNPDPALGMLSSLRVATRQLPDDATGLLLWPVDHPLVTADTVRALVERGRSEASAIVIPVRDGRRGHPVLFDRTVFRELEEAPLEVGARAVVRKDPERVATVDVDDPGVLRDIDRPGDYRRWVPDPERSDPDGGSTRR